MCEVWTRLVDGTLVPGVQGKFKPKARAKGTSDICQDDVQQTVVAQFGLRPNQMVLIHGGTRTQRVRPLKF